MADEGWRQRVGIEINYSSDNESSDEETGNVGGLHQRDRRGSIDQTNDSFEESVDGLHIDAILNKYADYGHTPPRTRISNKEKQRKWRDDTGDSRDVPKTVYAGRTSGRKSFASFKPNNNIDGRRSSVGWIDSDQQKMEKHKRQLKLYRESQRDFKLDLVNSPTSSVTFPELLNDRAESLPVIKVETSNRFMSLTSKLVPTHYTEKKAPENVNNLSGSGGESILPLKSSNDRIALHRILSDLIRSGNSERCNKSSKRQMSREEHLWQNELKDLIWLELQAWHAERTPTEQDLFVCHERTKIAGLLNEIMNYHFVRKSAKELGLTKRQSRSSKGNIRCRGVFQNNDEVFRSREDVFAPVEPKKSDQKGDGDRGDTCLERTNWEVPRKDLSNEGGRKVVDSAWEEKSTSNDEYIDDCPGCYSMYCKVCMANQNNALGEVESFLQRLGYAEDLYPSCKALAEDYPLYKSQEFIMRIKAICLWYNMTRHHLLKIIILGKLLLQFKTKKQNWPLDYREGSGTPDDLPSSPWTSASSTQSCSTIPPDSSGRISISSSSSGVADLSNSALYNSHSPAELDNEYDRERCSIIKETYRSEIAAERECCSHVRKASRVTFALDCLDTSMDANESEIPCRASSSTGSRVHSVSGEEISSHVIYSASMSVLDEETMDLNSRKENGSPYQVYIERMLKTKGLRKALHFIERLHRFLLSKSRISLQRPKSAETISKCPLLEARVSRVVEGTVAMSEQEERELQRHGYWSPEAQDVGLPSYIAAFLFICRIPLDVIHAYLEIRFEQKPKDPSVLSIRQLMREFKEGLQIAVLQRQRYLHLIRTALWKAEPQVLKEFEDGVNAFDRSMKNVLEVYLEYLEKWVLMVQQESLLISTYQKSLLEEEWSFVKSTCQHIPGGEILAGNSFCQMARSMLRTIGEYLISDIDELISSMDENWLGEDSTKHVLLAACRSLHSIFIEARERALKGISFAKTLRKDLEIAAAFSLNSSPQDFLKRLQQTGHVQVMTQQPNKHLIFIPGSIRHCPEQIRKLFNVNCSVGDDCLSESEKNSGTVGLASIGGQEASSPCNTSAPASSVGSTCGVYILFVNGREGKNCSVDPNWEGESINLLPTAEITGSLSHVEVEGVLLVAYDPSQLASHRRSFIDIMGDTIKVVHESRPSSKNIAQSLMELKTEALHLRDCITGTIQVVEEKCDLENIMELEESERHSIHLRCREILHQCYKFGFQYHKELSRLVTGEARAKLSIGMIDFARQWMTFVQQRCERGRGIPPKWAQQGLEFISAICDPRHTQHISDKDFQDLKSDVEQCITHVIGCGLERTTSSSSSLTTLCPTRIPSPVSSNPNSPHPVRRIFSSSDARIGATSPIGAKSYRSSRSLQDGDPSEGRKKTTSYYTNGNECETLGVPNKESTNDLQRAESPSCTTRMDRVRRAVSKLDAKREERLVNADLIGRMAPETQRTSTEHTLIRSRSVTFNWQRGTKLGQGRFGKVYTAVNNLTGELMAMKEMQLHPNDRTVIRSVSEELRIFEGIHHRHLVRYYGVEIHREEMLIFMEYCTEGTLENLVAATAEAAASGLPEPIIRRYTLQLLQAVATLHHHGIVHRDIKSANIFLTDEGKCLKLGDFGSAVQIKAHTTLFGELKEFVGTLAYMAPEVFMKSTHGGHGRAADIWSVGCVVVEMASGKRPWHEYDSNYQIMFKVGMGEIPAWPATLSQEGEDFLKRCLEHETRNRETAAGLLNHNFVKVEIDEEYQSIPLPSILEDYLKNNQL